MPTPQTGTLAPDFSLPADDGSTVHLADLRGRPVVLYFYPRDDTPGCTTEACDFRDRRADWEGDQALKRGGAVVLGVSADSGPSHQRFRAKFDLPFPLLTDADHQVMEAYGAWGEKMLYGRRHQGVIRSTFLIDREGRVAQAWPKVTVSGHVAEVLRALAGLG